MSDYEHSLSKEIKSNSKTLFEYVQSKPKYASSIPDVKHENKFITSVTIFNSFKVSIFNVFTRGNNSLPAFEPDCHAIISKVVCSEDRVEKKLLNLNPY